MLKNNLPPLPDGIQEPPFCVLCRGPVEIIGEFWPTADFLRRVGLTSSQCERIYYGLCEPCWRKPYAAILVEQRFLHQRRLTRLARSLDGASRPWMH